VFLGIYSKINFAIYGAGMDKNKQPTPKIIQSVDRALSILEFFNNDHSEAGVTELSTALNLNKSTVFGLISTLENRGYLVQNPENGKYRLGFALLERSSCVNEISNLAIFAKPLLQKLVETIQETVHMAVYERGEVIYIEKVESNQTLQIASYIGKRNPAHCTGVGKCLLAFQPEQEIDRVLAGDLQKVTSHTTTNPETLKQELQSIRSTYISFDNEEFALGLRCIAVPVKDVLGNVCAALSVSFPTIRSTAEKVESLKLELTNTSMEISKGLGLKS